MLLKLDTNSKVLKYDKVTESSKTPGTMKENSNLLVDARNLPSHILVVERIKTKVPTSNVEHAVRIFTMGICVLSAMLGLMIIMVRVRSYFMADGVYMREGYYLYEDPKHSVMVPWSAVIILFLVQHIFSLILLKGLSEKQSKLVLVYIVFGLLVHIFGTVFMVAVNFWVPIPTQINLVFTVIYILKTIYLCFIGSIFRKYELREERESQARCNPVIRLPARKTETAL